MKITKDQAQKFLIVYHHLHHENPLESSDDLLKYVEKIGCIQYDPINVLAYNSHLVLQSRYRDYQAAVLDECLYTNFDLIDAWDKNQSIYRVNDDPYFFRYRDRTYRYYDKLNENVRQVIPGLRDRIKAEGPLSSLDVKDSPQVNWSWAPTKAVRAALDYMFSQGDIYVHHKVNTRKYYDLVEHHPQIKRGGPVFANEDAYYDWHLLRRIGGVGILPAMTNSYAFIAIDGLKASIRRESIKRLIDKGDLVELEIEGIRDLYHIRSEDVPLLLDINQYEVSHLAHIIAPLDNLIWDRVMVKELFDFDYKWEVYEPLAKRKYGYYVIPVLYQHRFIGRFVGKYNRESNKLEINHLYFEEGVNQDEAMMYALNRMFLRFARALGASDIKVMKGCKNSRLVHKIKNMAK